MPSVLDIIWVPKPRQTVPPAGQYPAIYRGDTFSLPFRFWSDEAKTVPYELEGTLEAHLRADPLRPGIELEVPLAEFEITPVDNLYTLSLASSVTRTLITKGYWDFQHTLEDNVQTLYRGKFLVQDDATWPS